MAQCGPNPFIITTPLQLQPDQESRRNARSYAMRGKNRGKGGKRRVQPPCLASWINGPSTGGWMRSDLIPQQIGSRWAVGRFVEDINPEILENIFKFLVVLERASHPNPVLAESDVGPQDLICFDHMRHSQTFFHSQLFVTMAYFNMIGGGDGDMGTAATFHMTKALGFLRTDLATIDRATTEATLLVVSTFAMVAFVIGDIASAKNHIHGLFKLVTMRGGLRSLRANPNLQIKCCRLDLSYAIITRSKPLFFADGDIPWNLYLARSTTELRSTAIHPLLPSDSEPDYRLVNVWHDLYEFSRTANIATQTGQKLDANLLQEVMISVQYRLLHLNYDETDAHELLRMVSLAYSTTIFPLLLSQFSETSSRYLSLPSSMWDFLKVPKQASREKLKLLMWLLVIVQISIVAEESLDLQLARAVQALDLNSWDEALIILKSFLWVDILHSEQAKRIFDKIGLWD